MGDKKLGLGVSEVLCGVLEFVFERGGEWGEDFEVSGVWGNWQGVESADYVMVCDSWYRKWGFGLEGDYLRVSFYDSGGDGKCLLNERLCWASPGLLDELLGLMVPFYDADRERPGSWVSYG